MLHSSVGGKERYFLSRPKLPLGVLPIGQYALVQHVAVTVVAEAGLEERWSLEWVADQSRRAYLMHLRSIDGRVWRAEGGDVFDCLFRIRQQTDAYGLKICVNGARRCVWATGIMRDMAQGLSVEVFDEGSRSYGKRHFHTLDPAPADDVVTTDEQRTWIDNWWSRASDPAD